MILFLVIPAEFLFSVFLLGAGAMETTNSWLQTIEAHYLLIFFIAYAISFVAILSAMYFGNISIFYKILLVVIFLTICATSIGNYVTWSTVIDRQRQLQSLTEIFKMKGYISQSSSSIPSKDIVVTKLFMDLRISIGYLCFFSALEPLISYVSYRMDKNNVLSISVKILCIIMTSCLVGISIILFRQMIGNIRCFV